MLRFEYVGWVGWGGILTFMYLAYIRGCYAAATSLVRGWVGWGGILTFMYLAYIRGCYAAATSLVRGWVGWDINVHVPCVHTWMLRCSYVTGQGLGGVGRDINVHVPCVHTWMLRCSYVTGQGLGGVGWGGILTFMYLACMMNVENFQRCSIILLEHT